MQKLFVDFIPEGSFTIGGEQARHIGKSLRMKPGDMLTLSTGGGTDYGCMIESVGVDCVTLRLCYEQPADCEPTVTVRLFQGMPKGDKLEDVVQKCTELGVCEITPVLTRRSVSRPQGRAAEKKCARYRRIALEAAQQSGRGIVPDISEITDLKSALATDDSELKILFYEGGGDCLKNIIPPGIGSVSVYIGPEGGFDRSEVDMLINGGAVKATLGKRILRTQTAPVAALAAIMLITGNLE